MENQPPAYTAFDWARYIAGCIIFCGMMYAYVFVKEFNLLLFIVPAFLIGLKPEQILKDFGGKSGG